MSLRGMSELVAAHDWIKAFHIISVVAWMAGLLYLPRLFVYHAETRPGSDAAETFKVMERRLLRGIMTPAMIASYVFGLALAATPGVVDWRQGWIYVKLAAVLALTAHPRPSRPLAPRLCRRPQPAPGAFLSHRQRDTDPAADRHRRHGGGAAVLGSPLTTASGGTT